MKKSILFSVLSFIIVIGLLVSLLASLAMQDFNFSLSYFLQIVSSVPDVTGVFTFNDLTITGSWGIFDFLRNFLNLFTSVLSFLVLLVGNLVQVVVYIFYFVRAFFVPLL